MPRAKKTEDVALEATQEAVEAKKELTAEDLRTACIKLGLRICSDFEKGAVRPEAALVNAVTELFKAVKDYKP